MHDYFISINKKIVKFRSRHKKNGLRYSIKAIFRHFERFFLIGFLIKILLYPYRIIRRIWFIINNPSVIKDKLFFLIVKIHPILLNYLCAHADSIRRKRIPVIMSGTGKKTVLHVTCSFDLGGTQRQIINLCENSRDGNFIHQAIEYFPEQNYLYRKDISLDSDRYVQGNFFTRMLGNWTLNCSYRSLQLLQVYKLVRDFKEHRPDIVIGWGHEAAMLSFLAASFARIPGIIFCIRTFNPTFGWTTIGPLLEKSHNKMIPLLNGIIVNSTQLQKDYSEWMNIPEEKISVCANGIESHPFTSDELRTHREEIRAQFTIPGDAVVIVHVGRFSKEKGQMLLVQAYRRVIEKHHSEKIYCLLCGDGPTQLEVKDYVNKNKLSEVFFVGRIDNIHSYLSTADIFVMPSDFEGMPNALMEAMSYGLPCVSTNRTGAMDIARDNHEALYVDVGSVEQLAEKLSCLIERPDERQRLGANAKERLKEFSISKMVETFNGHLEEIFENFENHSVQ